MREKRKHHRVSFEVELLMEAKGEVFSARSVDISLGGMFVRGEQVPEIGTPVDLKLALPGVGSTTLPAFVRWRKEGGVGLQFGLIGPRETRAIGKLVRGSSPAL